jgi:hypothetical protein
MRTSLFLIIITLIATASHAEITLTLERNWVIGDAQSALGLDIWGQGSQLRVIFTDQAAGGLGSFDPATGEVVGVLPLSSPNSDCFGVIFAPTAADTTWYTNDQSDDCLYRTTDLSTWYTEPNPSLQNGRGMDFDGIWCWETCSGTGVYRFQPGGSSEHIPLTEIQAELSGLTVFPLDADLGLAVTCYDDQNFYFYRWNGSGTEFLGSAPCPDETRSSCNFGLAYSESEQMIYWSYISTTDQVMIAEVSFDLGFSLEQSSWGGIKSLFSL